MSQKAKNTKSPTQPSEVLGSGISNEVVQQLIAREELVSRFEKDNNHLMFFHQNGAWARIASSVNTLTEKETLELATGEKNINQVKGSHALAYNNVIMGGTLKQGTSTEPTFLQGGVDQQIHNPVNIDEKGYISKGDIKGAAYHNYENLGFRPTPGITSVTVQSKGTYGTLREAEVSVSVWDLADLEMMQALYLRPGYTILLEWGHSLQLDSESKQVEKDIQLYTKFVQGREKFSQIEKALDELRQNSSQNYDAMFGYVSNFSWKFRQDGGYDCTIKVIAKGSLLESIAATFDPSNVYPPSQMRRGKSDKGKTERKSIYHKLFSEMADFGVEAKGSIQTAATLASAGLITPGQAVQVASDSVFGNTQILQNKLETVDTVEGQIAMENQAFVSKFNKLTNGGSTVYNDDTQTWDSTTGVAKLNNYVLADYLNTEFGIYGLRFTTTSAGSKVSAFAVDDPINGIRIESDNVFDKDNLNETLRLAEFIQENAKLPAEQLSEKQLQQRNEREQRSRQREVDRLRNEAERKQTQSTAKTPNERLNPYTVSDFISPFGDHFKQHLKTFVAFRLKDLEDEGTGSGDDDDLNEYWMPLTAILDVFNNYVSILDQTQEPEAGSTTKGRKLIQFYTGEQDEDTLATQYQQEAKFTTNEYHFSIDPLICVLPKRPRNLILTDSKGQILQWPNNDTSYPAGQLWRNGFHESVEKAFDTGLLRGSEDDILNILVSCQYLKAELDKIVQTQEDSDKTTTTDMVSFLKTILAGINDSLGGINDLDLFFDEQKDLFYIIDRRATPKSKEALPKLALSGTRSVITDLSIDSKISSDIGKMVSIAAQGTGGHSKDNIGPLLQWNRGLLDRHILHKSIKNDEEGKQIEEREKPEDVRLKNWIEDYYKFWEELNGESFWDRGDYMRSTVNNLKNYHKEFCQKWVIEKVSKNPNDPIPLPGVIPVELSFSTMGVGGIKIGQAFTIEEGLLPKKYSEDFGYIITGLDHQIANSKWTTNIKTQFFPVTRPLKEEIEAFEDKVPTASTQYKAPNDTPDIKSNPDIIGDPAPIINPNKVGAVSYDNSPLAISLKARGYQNAKLNLNSSSVVVPLKEFTGARKQYVSIQTQTPDYFLHPAAAAAYQKWKQELKVLGVDIGLVSAYRDLQHQADLAGSNSAATTQGISSHGWAGAVDVGIHVPAPRTSLKNNLAVRKTDKYVNIATIGAKYGWYNPWRLSDNAGTMDEAWHFEYWGKV